MTNAIEQAKREMYDHLESVKGVTSTIGGNPAIYLKRFEEFLEAYLELMRQDHEALHETARKRFEDLQVAEGANQELIERNDVQAGYLKDFKAEIECLTQRLAKMNEERDSIQLRLHAVDHAYKTQQDRMATPVKDSGDRGVCEAKEANATAIQIAAEDIRKISDAWAMSGRRAKKSMLKISGILARPEVYAALEAIEKPATCMHSFFAIGDDQMKCTFCGVGK